MPIPALAPVLRPEDVLPADEDVLPADEDVLPADEDEAAGPGVLDAVELLETFEVIS
jgi:hypothetical protein